MPKEIDKIWVYRIIHYGNLEYILGNGIYCRNSGKFDPGYINIGSPEIINHRDTVPIKCYPETIVNEYIPFYFGIRTPMLYKIKTGHGVPKKPQDEIVYLCCKFIDLTQSNLKWCFTDGNAAKYITAFYNKIEDIKNLDWQSIDATEWRDENADGDHDRMRKKQSEFLIRDHVPVQCIKKIIVLTKERKLFVDQLVQQYELNIQVDIDTKFKFYYQ